ncbi:MAG TPA: ABC transporter substrate-binding protein [Thermoleophilia bacterium]
MTAGTRYPTRLFLLLLTAVLGAGLIWGLTGAFASDPSASPGGGKIILKVGWSPDPDNLNPFVGVQQSSYELWHISYDFLTNYGDKYLETTPGLAESWTSSPDGLTWTFKIRSGVMWSDGVPLTAQDIAFTYNWEMKLQLQAFLSALDGIESASAPDATTLVIKCSRPKADILSMWCPILPEHIWSQFKTSDDAKNFLNKPPIVGSGPFQVVEWKKGKYVRCVANKQYWGGTPKADEVIFGLYTNQDTLAQDLKLGTIDLAINIPPAQVKALQGDPSLASEACSQKAFDYLSFNCYKGPSLGNPVLRDVKFRQALNWGIDKTKMTDLAYQGYADPATTIFEVNFYDPSLDWHWQPPAAGEYQFDPAKARQLLADAGYKDTDGDGILNDPNNGDKNIALRLWSRRQSPQSQAMGKLIAGWWTDLGLDIKYSVEDESVLIDGGYNYVGNTFKPDYDIYIWAWQPSGSDPGRRLGYFRTAQIENQNDACWSNAEYDKLWQQQSEELDQQARKDIAYKMQEILYRESPYIVLTYPKLLEAWNTSRWQGWQRIPQPNGAVAFISDNVSNYYVVGPKTATTTSSNGSTSTGLIVGIIIAAIVVGIVVLLLRRKPRVEEG